MESPVPAPPVPTITMETDGRVPAQLPAGHSPLQHGSIEEQPPELARYQMPIILAVTALLLLVAIVSLKRTRSRGGG